MPLIQAKPNAVYYLFKKTTNHEYIIPQFAIANQPPYQIFILYPEEVNASGLLSRLGTVDKVNFVAIA